MPSIGVLEHYQQATDKPSRRIKRSGGKSLVRQQKADWITENVLLKMRPVSEHPTKAPATHTPYIPFGLEPAIDARIGVKALFPVLSNQIRVRPVRNQESYA